MKTFVLLAVLLTATIHHSVSSNAATQAAFDRGLLDYYAYNPEAAEHEFYTAADLDPQSAMAYWGIALSNAPNLNVPANDDRDAKARRAILRAKSLEANATPEDRAFIDAAVARFAGDRKAKPDALEAAYRDALQAIARANPGDPDAAALYAEAALYSALAGEDRNYETMSDQQRAAFRARVAAVLPYFQSSLATFPMHVGLEHFYIHAAQYAGQSSLAIDAARHLAAFSLPNEDSHLTHMPGHTFFDVGLYDEALDGAQRSVDMDYADYACCHPGFYSATRYYHRHNVNFLLYAMTETGRAAESVAVAQRAGAYVVRQMVAAGQWKQIVAMGDMGNTDTINPFARGLAFVHLGDAAGALAALAEIPDASADSPSGIANVAAMRLTLGAEIAELKGDDAKALQMLGDASASATKAWQLSDPEMPDLFYYSPHLALARLAARVGKTDVARAALQAELVASPRSRAATDALEKLGSI